MAGEVKAAAGDGAGGFYVGGKFAVGFRRYLVHVLPNGQIDWRFYAPFSAPVTALTFAHGRLYVATAPEYANGAYRAHLWSLDPTYGGPDPAFSADVEVPLGVMPTGVQASPPPDDPCPARGPGPRPIQGSVRALAATADRLYVAGGFIAANNSKRRGLVALNAKTGELDIAFDPQPQGDPTTTGPYADVTALAISGPRLMVGGGFDVIGGRRRRALAALDARSGRAEDSFATTALTSVSSIAVNGETVFATGYSSPGNRSALLALDATSGSAVPGFGAVTLTHPGALTAVGQRVYVTEVQAASSEEEFSRVGRVVALDAHTGRRDPHFSVLSNSYGEVLATSGARLFYGGGFDSAGGVRRLGIAAVDAKDGELDERFDAEPARDVAALIAAGGRLYAAGTFAAPRRAGRDTSVGLVALNPTTGRRYRRFRPRIASARSGLARIGRTLYATDAARRGVIAVDARTGARRSEFRAPFGDRDKNARRRPIPTVLEASASRLYVGILAPYDRARHRGVVALDPRTGRALQTFRGLWLPHTDRSSSVRSLVYTRGRLFAAGDFKSARGIGAILALDPGTGRPLPGFRRVPIVASALAVLDDTLVIAADRRILNVSAKTGRGGIGTTQYSGSVCSLLPTSTNLYVGGAFWSWDERPRSNFIALPLTPSPAPPA